MEGAADGSDKARRRVKLLKHLENTLETPMVIFEFAWLVLAIVDLSQGLPPLLQWLNMAIWGLSWRHVA